MNQRWFKKVWYYSEKTFKVQVQTSVGDLVQVTEFRFNDYGPPWRESWYFKPYEYEI